MDVLLIPVFILLKAIGALFFENGNWIAFIIITIILGGGAAFLSGRALALTWRSVWLVLFAALALGAAVRFLHFALAGNTLLTPYYYGVDAAICLLFGLWGYRVTRAGQMSRQYGWLYQRVGSLNWARSR